MGICQFNAALNGISDFVVASATALHFTPGQSSVIDGNVYTYYAQIFDTAVPPNVVAWEAGSGAYVKSTNTLKRTTIIANSNDDLLPVNFATPPIVDVYTSSSTRLEQNQSTLLVGSVDLNTVADPGTYACQLTSCTNGPFVGGQWYITVIVYSGDPTNYLMQEAVDLSPPNARYTRTKVTGTWGAWRKYPGEIGTGAAIAGDIGEQGSTALITGNFAASGTVQNITSLSVPAGDFEVLGLVLLAGAGATTSNDWSSIISTTSTPSVAGANSISGAVYHNRMPGALDYSLVQTHLPWRVSNASPTTYYLHAQAFFSGGSYSYQGIIRYRRAR